MTKQLKVDSVVNLAGSGKPNFPVSPTSGGAALSTLNTHSYTSSATEPSSPKNGAIWWDSANSKVYVYANGEFKEITLNTDYPSAYSNQNAWSGHRGIVGGTKNTGYNGILYFDVSGSGGGSANFGDLTVDRRNLGAGGSSSRSCFFGGYTTSATRANTIDYVTPSTTGNAQDFGDLTSGRSHVGCTSNGTRVLTGGGYNTQYVTDVDYITIATTGNATDFGDLQYIGNNFSGNQGSGDLTRGLFLGGIASSTSLYIDYFTYASPSNATDFGDLLFMIGRGMACSDATRVVQMGGSSSGGSQPHSPSYKNIQYVTTQTTGNASDFGDLLEQYTQGGACANHVRGVAIASFNVTTQMEAITIQTTGDATDFGDLITGMYRGAATSGSPS